MQYIINISQFNEIVNGIKAMKADLVLVSGDMLFGVDNNFIILKSYHMNLSIPTKFVVITKTLTGEFYNNITDVNIVIDTDINKIYCPNNSSYIEDKPEMIDNRLIWRIEQMSINLGDDMAYSIIKNYDEITNDINFNTVRNIKASEGAVLYNPNNDIEFGMYLYSGAIPMVKADKLYLTIYDNGPTFIAKFTVQKKKINPVEIYFKFVKLQK